MFILALAFLITIVLFAHFIADFALQTSWMALGKSKSLKPLLAHIAVYTVALFILTSPYWLIVPIKYMALFCLVNGLLHMATDFFTSKLSSWAFKEDKISLFWLVIGFDQFVHTITFVWTAALGLYYYL